MAKNVTQAQVQIKGKDSTSKAFNSVQGRLARMTKSLKGMAVPIGAVGAVAGGMFVKMANDAVNTADNIRKVSSSTGVTTDSLQEMRHAFSLAGVETGVLDKGLQNFSKAIGEARVGTGALTTFLNKSNKALLDQLVSAKDNTEAFEILTKEIASMNSMADRTALSSAALGRAGKVMTVAFEKGAEAFEKAKNEAQKLGLVISEDLLRDAEQINDDFLRLESIIKTKFTKAVLENAESILALISAMTDLVIVAADLANSLGGIPRFFNEADSAARVFINTLKGVEGISPASLSKIMDREDLEFIEKFAADLEDGVDAIEKTVKKAEDLPSINLSKKITTGIVLEDPHDVQELLRKADKRVEEDLDTWSKSAGKTAEKKVELALTDPHIVTDIVALSEKKVEDSLEDWSKDPFRVEKDLELSLKDPHIVTDIIERAEAKIENELAEWSADPLRAEKDLELTLKDPHIVTDIIDLSNRKVERELERWSQDPFRAEKDLELELKDPHDLDGIIERSNTKIERALERLSGTKRIALDLELVDPHDLEGIISRSEEKIEKDLEGLSKPRNVGIPVSLDLDFHDAEKIQSILDKKIEESIPEEIEADNRLRDARKRSAADFVANARVEESILRAKLTQNEEQVRVLQRQIDLARALGRELDTDPKGSVFGDVSEKKTVELVVKDQMEMEKALENQLRLGRSLEDVFDRMGDGLVWSMQRGEDAMASFRNAALAALFDVQREMLKVAVFNPVKKGIVSLASSFLPSIFGGAREKGGAVKQDKAYLVGEKGPELFMPKSSGKIIPHKETEKIIKEGTNTEKITERILQNGSRRDSQFSKIENNNTEKIFSRIEKINKEKIAEGILQREFKNETKETVSNFFNPKIPVQSMERDHSFEGLRSLFPGNFGGARESGGGVSSGMNYLVGERGREIFLPSSSSSRASTSRNFSNERTGKAETVNNNTENIEVNMNFTTGIQATVRAEVMAMMPNITNTVKAAVADSRMRGGAFSKAMRGY